MAMRIRLLILVCAWLLAAWGAACSSAGKCKRGERGCACAAGKCVPAASCIAGVCMRASPSTPMVRDEDAAVAMPCSAGSFEEACRSYCMVLCKSQVDFCLASHCEAGYCDMTASGPFASICATACGSEADPVGCMRDLCDAQTRGRCEDFRVGDADAGTLASACFDDDPRCVVTGR